MDEFFMQELESEWNAQFDYHREAFWATAEDANAMAEEDGKAYERYDADGADEAEAECVWG